MTTIFPAVISMTLPLSQLWKEKKEEKKKEKKNHASSKTAPHIN